MVLGRLSRALDRPVDAGSCAVFRVLFGALLLFSTLRFLSHGWIAELYRSPRYFFSYWGFAWIKPWPGPWMSAHYAVLAAAALCILLGIGYRTASIVFALGFGYAHFCDKSTYLNHYYLITLLAGMLACLPLDRELSLRALRQVGARRGQVRAWALYLLRFQIAVVYIFGGIGKLHTDWLVHGEPLRLWLAADAGLPLLGRFFRLPGVGLAFSWAGALFDLSIVPLLSWRATRRFAYAAVLVFHVLTAVLFHIGMFPWLMIVSATLFFEPSWPRDLARRWSTASALAAAPGVAGEPLGRLARIVAAGYALLQVGLPLRSALYPGNTLWTEEGFRFAWKVMLIDKAATLELKVVDDRGRTYFVSPREYLSPFQVRQATTQPDMILELSQIVARDFEQRGHGGVRVYADSEVSFNGRFRRRMIDPTVDLAQERDSLAPKRWILPAPSEPPVF
ncbi:MAG: HTTM domain-containing protein [Myxococcales bacterium]